MRKDVAFAQGFRKHVISTFIEARLNHEIREFIVDHDTRLYENYFRPTEQKVLEEYLKAEPYLTIDPSMRLIQENQILKVNIDKYEGMFDRIEMLEKRMQEKLR